MHPGMEWGQGVLGRNGNKLSDYGYIFQVEPGGIPDALAIGYRVTAF